MFEIYKLSGTSTIDEATAESIREQVWQQMVRELIQDKQYNKLGIGVSTEEVDEMVLVTIRIPSYSNCSQTGQRGFSINHFW